jgi:hypothetical protein
LQAIQILKGQAQSGAPFSLARPCHAG